MKHGPIGYKCAFMSIKTRYILIFFVINKDYRLYLYFKYTYDLITFLLVNKQDFVTVYDGIND